MLLHYYHDVLELHFIAVISSLQSGYTLTLGMRILPASSL